MTNIRSLSGNEGLLLKELRLGALKDSPDSFSPLYEEFKDQDDNYWHTAAKNAAANDGFELFIAEDEGIPCGLVSGHADEDGIGDIGAMWVSPIVRGKGVGKQLLDEVLNYLQEQGCTRIKLTVTETNQVAINLYSSRGFAMSGDWEPLRKGSPLKNLEMVR